MSRRVRTPSPYGAARSRVRAAAPWVVSPALLCACAVAVLAQVPADPAARPMRYRRVYAPADQLQAWPFQNEQYLPVPADEFEALVRRAEAAAEDAGLPDGSEVRACRYTARFDEIELTGTGELDLRRKHPDARLVRLAPLAMAVFDAQWKQAGDAARWGAAAGGDVLLLVDRDDTLGFSWKQRVERESAEVVSLAIDFPQAPVAELVLELPEAYDVQRGEYVVERGAQPVEGRYRWTLRGAGGRWRVRFAKRDAVQDVRRNGVRIDSAYDYTERGVELTAQLRIDAVHAPLETLALDLDPGLTLVDARLPDRRLTWYAAGEAPRPAPRPAAPKPAATKPPTAGAAPSKPAATGTKQAAAAPRPANAAAATTSSPAAAGAQRYVLEFERPLVGTGRTLFIKAVAPLVVGRRHRVPMLRAPELFWNHAALTLSVPAPLEIVRLDPRDGVFTNPVPLAGERPGEAVEVQCFAPAAGVDLTLARRNRPIDASTVTLWNIREEDATAEFRGEFRVDVGSRFTLEADLPAKWIIDGVASSPTTALADWSLSDVVGGRRTLNVRLAQPLAPDRPLRLTITGRLKHHNVGDRLTRDELRFVEFRNVADQRPVLGFRAEEGLRLDLREGAPTSVVTTVDRLDPVRRELLGPVVPDLLLAAVDFWELNVRRRQADFAATIAVEARVGTAAAASVVAGQGAVAEKPAEGAKPAEPGKPVAAAPTTTSAVPRLHEHYRIRLESSAGAPLEQVRVRLAPAKPGALQWTLGGRRSGQITAVRVGNGGASPSPAAAAPAGDAVTPAVAAEETWEITFRRPIYGNVELEARRDGPLTERAAVSLAAVVDAASQTGTVRVLADAAIPLQVVNRTLTPLPAAADAEGAAAELGDRGAVRGEYRYQPSAAAVSDVAALELSPLRAAGENAHPAVVWLLRYDSKYDDGRRFEHRATLYLQSFGTGRCRLVVDEPARLTALRVNGVEHSGFGPREAVLPLDGAAKLLRVEVDYLTSDEAAGRLRMLELPVVRLDVPVLLAVRDVVVPARFDVPADAGLRSPRVDAVGLGLRRLFGPLVPADPRAAAPWASDPSSSETLLPLRLPRQPREAADVEACYARLGAALETLVDAQPVADADTVDAAAPSMTWGDLFAAAERTAPPGAPLVRFDALPLRIAGVVAEAPVVPPSGAAEGTRALGEQLLSSAGLVLAVDGRGLVVTSRTAANGADDDVLRVFAPQELRLARASAARMLTLADWKSEPEGAWSRLAPDAASPAGEPLGQDYVLSLSGDAWGLWIVRREIPPLLALALVAAGFVVGRKLFVAQKLLLPPAAALCAAAAALLPDWIGMAAASLLLGLAAGLAVCLILPPRYRPRSRTLGVGTGAAEDRRGSTLEKRAVQGVVVLLLSAGAARALAQTPTVADDGAAPRTPAAMVFIPSDASGKPNGDRYQVPLRLMQDLKAQADRGSLPQTPALVQNARYSAQIARDLEQARYLVTEFRATFDLFVLRAPATITLPFGVGVVNGTAGASSLTAQIDGRSVELAATAGGQAISFEATDAGPLRLELTYRPPAPTAATTSFSLTVPRVADAELHVVVPPEPADLQIPGAVEPLRWSTDRREARARLAASDKVAFSWAVQQAAAQTYSIDQLTWLRVRPGSIVLDMRLVVRPPAGGVKELVLAADPRLQWLPKRGQDSLVADVEQTPITSDQATVGQRVRLELTRPIVKEETVEVSFLLTGGAGTGNMRLPELRLADDTPGRRLFAYAVDPLMDSAVANAAGLKAVAVPEFLKTWGANTPLPQAAFELTSQVNNWTLTVRPKQAEVTVRETQTVTCGARNLEIALEAEVAIGQGLIYHHELQTPPNMTIDSVDVAELGDDAGGRVGRWSRDEQGKLMVFLRTPIGEAHRLTLRGRLPLETPVGEKAPAAAEGAGTAAASLERTIALPLVTTLGGKLDQRTVRVARRPEVLVVVDEAKDLEKAEPATDAGAATARIIEVLRIAGPKPSARLRLTPNARSASAQLVSTYVPEGKSWQYELQIAVDVQAGVLDELVLELPPQIATPLALNPSMPYEVVAATGGAARRLILRPRQAIDGKFEFLLQAGLTEARRDEPLPMARLLQLPSVTHFLRLPRHSGLTPIRWETSQLAPSRNTRIGGKPPAAQEWDAYRVVGPEPTVVMRSARGTGRPYVRLAEHRFLAGLDGTLVGLSSFLVEPAGMSAGSLVLPADARVLAVSAAGAVVTLQRSAAGVWTVPLASEQMPHAIDVLYERPSADGRPATASAVLPRWEGWRAERTLVVVFSERSGARKLPAAGNLVSRLRLNRERLAALDAALLELSDDGSRTADDWSLPLQERRRRVLRELRIDVEADPQSDESRAAAELLASATDAGPSQAPPTAARGEGVDLVDLWRSGPAEACDAAFALVGEDVVEVGLRTVRRDADADWRRIYLPLCCALFAVVCLALVRIDGFLRWPQLIVVVFGTAWLLLLRPTIVGWIILAVVVGCRLHPSLRHVRERTLNVSPKLSALRKS